MGVIGGLLQGLGAVFVFWGLLWFMANRYANAPGYLFGLGLLCLVLGWAISPADARDIERSERISHGER